MLQEFENKVKISGFPALRKEQWLKIEGRYIKSNGKKQTNENRITGGNGESNYQPQHWWFAQNSTAGGWLQLLISSQNVSVPRLGTLSLNTCLNFI